MITLCAYAGEYHCPVLNKVFTEFTHIVAVKTTGNVFCYEVCLKVLFLQFFYVYCRALYGFTQLFSRLLKN